MWKDSETELDFLDYDYLVQSVNEIILNDDLLPASIGVYGDWGSGKSSLMHMCKSCLEKEDKNIKCLMFNGWLFENYEDAKTAILGSILDEIGKKKTLSQKAKNTLTGLYQSVDKLKLAKSIAKIGADIFLTGGIGTLAGIPINGVASKLGEVETGTDSEKVQQSIKDKLDNKELREDIRKFQSDFAKLLKESKITRLVVFIDELDRCRPDTILDTLEAMKLFMFTGNVAFVIGADERHISYAVKSKFKDIEGIQINIGQEYLEKLVQYPIKIPRLNSDEVEIYIACLLLQDELEKDLFGKLVDQIISERKKDFEKFNLENILDEIKINGKESVAIAKQVASVLAPGLHGNPRQCKRFLNSLYMRMKMASYKNKTLDRKILAKIMMLEYIKPKLFNKIAEMTSEGTLQQELTVFEGDQGKRDLDKIEKLKIWIDDSWFNDWCSIEPKLAEEDLKLYFYFMRTSLDEKISRISATLSPLAKEVLDKLLSKSERNAEAAIIAAKDLSDAEAATILDVMKTKMAEKTKIETDKMKTFIKFILAIPSLHTEAFAHFDTFSAEQIPLGASVFIAELAKESKMETQYRDLATKWGKTNKNLQNLIENALDI